MNNVTLYCEVNLLSIAVLMILSFSCNIFGKSGEIKTRLFKYSAFCAIAADISDILWIICGNSVNVPSGKILVLLNCLYFAFLGFCVYFMALFFEPKDIKSVLADKPLMVAASIPVCIMLFTLVLTLFNGCLFYNDENMQYKRGPLFWILPVVMYGYVIIAAIKRIAKASKKHHAVYRDETMATIAITVPLVLCGVCQLFYVQVPSSSFAISVSFLLIYINSLKTVVVTDGLTGISNRIELIKKLKDLVVGLKSDERLYFLFIDIDKFKQINDVYGHSEGDRALKTVADVIKNICVTTKGYCGRYGGDEFAVIQILKKGERIEKLVNLIYSEIEKKSLSQNLAYTLNVSVGSAEYTSKINDVNELISFADINMYNKKREAKL